MDFFNKFDFYILDFIQEHFKNGFFDKIMPFISKLGDVGFIFILLTILLICLKKYRKTGLSCGLAIAIGFIVVSLILKPVVARIRPYEINTAISLLVEKLHDFSFPSGHTVIAFEFGSVIWLKNKKLGIVALVFAVLMAFSRLYLYVHFPTDVIASVILGVLFGIIATKLVDFYYKKKKGI